MPSVAALPLLLAAGLVQTGPSTVPIRTIVPADPRLATVRATLLERVQRGNLVSVSIAVTERGQTIWMESLGWADREGDRPAEPATSYALGSLSKSLAATVVLALAERGILDLDTPVDRWVPVAAPPDIRDRPTLRQLLDASGGIPHGWESAVPSTEWPSDSAWDAWLIRSAFVAFPPGTVFEYSNNSFGVAARVAERVTGTPFPALACEVLFDPLDMANAHGTLHAADTMAVAAPYSGSGVRIGRTASRPEAGLGMLASVIDLVRFGNFVRNGSAAGSPPLSPVLRAELWRPSAGPSGDFFHYGFWNVGTSLVTNGSIGGANAHLAMGRDVDLVVAVTVNQTGSDADAAAGAILDALAPVDPGTPSRRTAYEQRFRRPYGPNPLLGRWRGKVAHDGGNVAVELTAGPDSVLVRFGEAATMALRSPTLSAAGTLRGFVMAAVPSFEPGPTRVDIALARTDDRLHGYVLPRGRDAIPLRVVLDRAPR